MAKTTITKELTWKEIAINYPILATTIEGKEVEINKLQEAIDDGSFKAVMQSCANELHNGDFMAVVKTLRKNLSSQACNMRKQTYNPNQIVDWKRHKILDAFTSSLMPTEGGWSDKTDEEIDAYYKEGNERALQSVYDVMSSKLSKYPEQIEDVEEFRARRAVASKLLSGLKNQKKRGVSAELLAKLKAGKKPTAEELVLLADILSK